MLSIGVFGCTVFNLRNNLHHHTEMSETTIPVAVGSFEYYKNRSSEGFCHIISSKLPFPSKWTAQVLTK